MQPDYSQHENCGKVIALSHELLLASVKKNFRHQHDDQFDDKKAAEQKLEVEQKS